MRYLAALALTALLGLAACTSQPVRTWEMPPGVKYVRVNGYDMAYTEKGSGTPLVLVHGTVTDYRYFAAASDVLAQQHRVISVSLRHYYPEPWDGSGGSFSLAQHASDVAEFTRALGLGPVHLFGHSRGGTVALFVAKNNPDVLRSLILGEGGTSIRAFDTNAPAPGQPIGRAGQLIGGTLRLLEEGKKEDAAIYFVNTLSGPGAWDAAPDLTKNVVRTNLWTLKGQTAEVLQPFDCKDVANTPVPVLQIMGEKTSANSRRVVDAIQDCIKKGQRAVIPNAGHVFPRQAPREFAQALMEFTSRN